MKKVLVTGGSGFIGRNIAESYLGERYELHAPTRQQLDCSDEASVASYFSKHYFDAVVHSAAKPGHRNAADTTSIFFTNSRMIFNLLHVNDRWGKFINMGSGAIYDMRHYIPKMKESYFGTFIPADEHGYNKYILGKVFPTMENVYDFRIFGIFGKYEDYAIRFISNAICKAIFNLPITLRQNRKFDYLFIDDLYPILEHFIEHDVPSMGINITPNESVPLLEIAQLVKAIAGGTSEIIVGQEGMGLEYSGDNSLLHQIYPNVQFTPIEEAVRQLFDWYLREKDNLKQSVLFTDK